MSTPTLKKLFIVSATTGGADNTPFLQYQFASFIRANPKASTWTLNIDNAPYPPYDPNIGVLKTTVITYQYLLQNSNGKQAFSTL